MELSKKQWEKLNWIAHPSKWGRSRDGRVVHGWHRTFCSLERLGLCRTHQTIEYLQALEQVRGDDAEYEALLDGVAKKHPEVKPEHRYLFLFPELLPWDRCDFDLLKTTLHDDEAIGFGAGWSFTDKGAELWCEHSDDQIIYKLWANVYTLRKGRRPERREILESHPTKDSAMAGYHALLEEGKLEGRNVHIYGVYREIETPK